MTTDLDIIPEIKKGCVGRLPDEVVVSFPIVHS